MTLEIFPFCHHCGRGNSIWGWREFYCILIPSPHPDTCLKNKRWIGCEEGFYCQPCFIRLSVPVPLDHRLDCAAEVPGTLLVPPLVRLNPGIDPNTGIRRDTGLTVAFSTGWPGDGLTELGKHAVCLVPGHWGPDKELCTLP